MKTPQNPHVVILPFPAQGHVKPMLNLAMLLSNAGIRITFVTSKAVLDPLVQQINLTSFRTRFPSFQFNSLSDGFPTKITRESYASVSLLLVDVFDTIAKVTPRLFRELIASLCDDEDGDESSRPTCVIADGIMSFAIEVGDEFGIPVISFRTYSATCTWVYFHLQKLVDQRFIPFQQGEFDCPITCIPGLENKIRLRDLPSVCRQRNSEENTMLQFYMDQASAMSKASALILNTFNELEPDSISQLGSVFPNVYAIGPLQSLSREIIPNLDSVSSDGTLWKKDRSCMAWLDRQQPKSVLYISFGSFLTLTRDQRLEFWHGIVNSKKPFLWVTRSGSILDASDSNNVPAELVTATSERGLIVNWVPQEEVLAHAAIGGFLTHCGWNSTLEGITAGVGMIGWPGLADQQVNSRCIEEIWKVGIDIKDMCDRARVENGVRRLMDGSDQEMVDRLNELRRLARQSLAIGGSSFGNLKRLIEDMSKMSSKIYQD
uniref:Uridine 5'-diphospho-glucosyltransferase 22 n=1 Tax=Rhodiola rosea TaxID=203015 RepID=A0A2I6B3Q6_RHORB|nr:uridine 5'-diphospho-glucosyltransferase 22 [Rhodiola rosea]